MHRHHRVESGSGRTPPGAPSSAQYIGLMYSSASRSNRFNPSRTKPRQVGTATSGFKHMLLADSLTRAQWRSRSGVVPSNARAPSNTDVHNHAAWVRGPMIGTLPSCQSSSKKVNVCDQATGRLIESSFHGLYDQLARTLSPKCYREIWRC